MQMTRTSTPETRRLTAKSWFHPVNLITGVLVALSSGGILALIEEEPFDWGYVALFALFWIVAYPPILHVMLRWLAPRSQSNA